MDALKSSHPIEIEVHHPSEIDEIFDAISYSKGACVIRMLNDFLTNEVGFDEYPICVTLFRCRHLKPA